MANGLFPDTNSGMLSWATVFRNGITPTPTLFGLTAAQAAAFGSLTDVYSAALLVCQSPATKTKTAVAAKAQALVNLKANAKLLISIIEGQAAVTNSQKIALGLKIRSASTPIPAPADAPALDVVSVSGWTVKIKLHDTNPASKRGRPAGVAGASVFSFVPTTPGQTPPADVSAWTFEGSTSKTSMEIAFSPSVAPGTQVYLCARWFNPRSAAGPLCSPVSTNVQGGGVMAA